jgi:predicted RNase H-like HicB family nuclease
MMGMIRQYVDRALRRARYDKLDDGTYCAEVSELQGVLATGMTLEDCRDQLAEVVEEWVLVRVSQGLEVPALDDIEVKVSRAG